MQLTKQNTENSNFESTAVPTDSLNKVTLVQNYSSIEPTAHWLTDQSMQLYRTAPVLSPMPLTSTELLQ
jgi:hypothetical protein